MTAPVALEADDLHVTFRTGTGTVEAVRGISFALHAGQCLAIVGESGSGKSATARALLGLAGPNATVTAGALRLAGRNLTELSERQWRQVRGRDIGLVLQDALGSLNPLHRVRRDVGEPLRRHRLVPRGLRETRVVDALTGAGVPEPRLRAAQYPHQLSGGLRQRALIASAVIAAPPVLVVDEPTTALDVTVQAQVLTLLEELKAGGTALLMISHDLAVVGRMADHILVMRDGVIVESGNPDAVLGAARHPYTQRLLAAVPSARPGRPKPGPAGEPLLEVREVTKRYRQPDGTLRDAVHDVSFTVAGGRTLGIVGESGSGKSTVARIALGLLRPDAGEVRFAGAAWSTLRERERRPSRGRIQLIHQDPLGAFDPRFTTAQVVGEALHGLPDPAARRRRVTDLLETVGLPAALAERRPAEMSGGQRQRVAIARALAPGPDLLVCDEPVSALDVSIQAQILDLLAELQATRGLAMLFISHDLGVIRYLSDDVLVMKDGDVVERGPVDDVFERPQHPYTRQLLAAVPRLPVY
ncbi:ABC transporter ATP-binding protein [Dactylosporangium fulvum]|uniref:ABC transporter ATP-binding protein n=1 Tax=Dactylosporangium fulvum TaxID=53359 RepID=A0ABY5W5N6_9ACTN|nr:ABC transporter ATP-binding protein [Dactylosporangium fulvum]UWP85217.1 ABC transporter ATP-binding protein [Dactylosporangium fulvum]